jgi:two-component system OmpR family response regulator
VHQVDPEGASILVVDDDPDIRQLVTELLRLSGFVAESEPSGVAALARLDAAADADLPELVLLDVQMPELDGWDTLRQLRSRDRLTALRVILCTVKASSADAALGWALGCDGYVAKPFAIADLVAEVRSVLGRDDDARVARRAAALAASDG